MYKFIIIINTVWADYYFFSGGDREVVVGVVVPHFHHASSPGS